MEFIENLKRPFIKEDLEQGFKLTLPKQIEPKKSESNNMKNVIESEENAEFKITVKKYMTEKATPGFDFMEKFNKNIPMPFVTMVGTIEKETRGMYYMKLHSEPMVTRHCMKCGRVLTHPVSMLYGLGPECGKHAYINPLETEEELKAHFEEIKKKLEDTKWEGWVIKSALKEFNKIDGINKD